jgi:large subunit ribosomal protein L7/L12
MADMQSLVNTIGELKVTEIVELVKLMEEEFGVTAAAPVAVAAAPAAGDGAAAAEEKTDFDIHMTSYGEKKVNVIKEIRTITGLGLKEAKAMTDNLPAVVKEGVPKAEAEVYLKQLEDAGATAELK